MADPLDVPCPDCLAPPGVPCRISDPNLTGPHADRHRHADLRAVQHGTCTLCGRPMVQGTIEDAPLDAWHPDPDDAATCPPLPNPATHWDAYATALNTGLTPGHPGIQHFRPLGDPAEETATEIDRTLRDVAAVIRDATPATAAQVDRAAETDEPAPCTCPDPNPSGPLNGGGEVCLTCGFTLPPTGTP